MNIILYTIGCPMCNILKEMLVQNKMSFEENNDRDYMISLGFTHLPVLEVDGERMESSEAIKWVEKWGGSYEKQ